jgi:hypothetical protein
MNQRLTRHLLVPFLAALVPVAETAEVQPTTPVAPGVFYGRYRKDRVISHVLKVDLKEKSLQVRSIKARGTDTIRQMVDWVSREGTVVLGAINGDFFRQDNSTGIPYGVHVSDGCLVYPPEKRSMIGFGPKNEPYIGVVSLRAKISFIPPEKRGPASDWNDVTDVNVPGEETQSTGVYLYTPAFHKLRRSRPNGLIAVVETIKPALLVGELCEGVVTRVEAGNHQVEVPENGCLLFFAGGSSRQLEAHVKPGLPVGVKLELPPIVGGVSQAIGGGPRLIRDGKTKVEFLNEVFEPFQRGELGKRHPRSAIGYDRTRQYLYLVMVEGRHSGSQGMSFGELSTFMLDLGCYQAMGFDGGGSAGMFVAGKGFVSNGSEERAVANGLFITAAKSPGAGGSFAGKAAGEAGGTGSP